MVGCARFTRLSGHSGRLRSFVAKLQLHDKMVTYFALPEPIHYEYVEIELGPEMAKLGILRESLWEE